MTRQTQNVLIGAVACAVTATAMFAVSLIVLADDDSTVAGVDPLAGGATEIETEAEQAAVVPLADQTSPRSTLAVSLTPSSETTALVTSSTVPQSTTAAPTTSSTLASTTASSETIMSTETTVGSTETSSTDSSGGETTTSAPGTGDQPTSTTVSSTEPSVTAPPGGGALNEVEREIARLTNELRTNPNGELKRQGPVINCGGRIRVDNAGGYEAIGALEIHEEASLQVSRPWSAQMTRSNFNHQPNAGVGALQNLGIAVRSAGENIAYHNYSDKAFQHFSGWRESDGHFCNMMDPGFTHLAVGEVTKSDGMSFATQNFFSLQ